jgi:hypothetical protein
VHVPVVAATVVTVVAADPAVVMWHRFAYVDWPGAAGAVVPAIAAGANGPMASTTATTAPLSADFFKTVSPLAELSA